jgi:hypothetical protein
LEGILLLRLPLFPVSAAPTRTQAQDSSPFEDKEISMIKNSQDIHTDMRKPALNAPGTPLSREQLQEHWLRLRIRRRTLLYLQQVLDQQEGGVTAALIATEALSTEKRGKSVLEEGEELLAGELRTCIEEWGQHGIETLRILVGTFVGMQLRFSPPLFFWSNTASSTTIVCSLLSLLAYIGFVGLQSQWKLQRDRFQQTRIAPFTR